MGTPISADHAAPGFAALIPLIIMMIPIIFICYRLAKDKKRDTVLYTVLGCIPLVNYFILIYLIGSPNLILEKKVDRILFLLEKKQSDENVLEL
jgi:hypothetical protein